MIELHIYGPALGLPSIDTKCLAAVTLLQACLDGEQWRIFASNDPSISPFNELPALRTSVDNVELWVTGFANIAAFLESQATTGSLRIKDDFTFHGSSEEESAQITAYLAFLESRGLPLLDLSLYVSSDNYTNVTRTVLSQILPWPQSWLVPTRLRDAARKRSEHLGLSGLDVDAVREKELQKENSGISAAIPKSLRTTKKSVTGLLGSSAEQTRFKLEAVTMDFFEPLQEFLGEKKWMSGESATPLDCYALAVFSHMAVSDLPQPWLRHALEKYPTLYNWTQATQELLLSPPKGLPWGRLPKKPVLQLAQGLIDVIADSMPIALSDSWIYSQSFDGSVSTSLKKYQAKQAFRTMVQQYQNTTRNIVTGCVASAGIMGLLIYGGVISLTAWKTGGRTSMNHRFGTNPAFFGLG